MASDHRSLDRRLGAQPKIAGYPPPGGLTTPRAVIDAQRGQRATVSDNDESMRETTGLPGVVLALDDFWITFEEITRFTVFRRVARTDPNTIVEAVGGGSLAQPTRPAWAGPIPSRCAGGTVHMRAGSCWREALGAVGACVPAAH